MCTVVLFKNIVCNIDYANHERETYCAHSKRMLEVRTLVVLYLGCLIVIFIVLFLRAIIWSLIFNYT